MLRSGTFSFDTVRWSWLSHASPYGVMPTEGETTGAPATPFGATGNTSRSPPKGKPFVNRSDTATAVPCWLKAMFAGRLVGDEVTWNEPGIGVRAHLPET